MTKTDIEVMQKAKQFMDFMINEGEFIFKIIGIVQDNKEFFNVRVGDSCLRAAAEKLELLVRK